MKHKILLDTDIGSDIDDALCLSYLLANPKSELLGITTVTGQSAKRAMLASVLCKIAGKDIPIFPGEEKPLKIQQQQKEVPQEAALNNWEHDTNFPKNKAIAFLEETIHSHPGEITLLCIGPLTNTAILFGSYPEISSLLKEIVLMCGIFFDTKSDVVLSNGREWNAFCDPDAAEIVFKAKVKKHVTVGLDVTHRLTMNSEEVKQQFNHPLLHAVEDFSKSWFAENKTMTFHDPLTATIIFNRAICTFQKGEVEVELKNKTYIGKTYFDKKGINNEVATKVNNNKFFNEYFSVFK